MNPILRRRLLTLALLNALPLAALADDREPATVPAAPSALTITEVWSRPTAPGASTGAGFLRIRNPGPEDERLLGAVSARAGRVELHQQFEADGVTGMRPLVDGLVIPAGGEVRLSPSGTHLMLLDLRAPLTAGERVPLTLRFARTGEVPVALRVESAAPETPRRAAKPPASTPSPAPAADAHAHH